MMLPVDPPDERAPRLEAKGMKEALSHWARVEILMVLDKQAVSVEELTEAIASNLSIDDVKYHLGVLDEAGCLEVTQGNPSTGTTRVVYRIKRDVLLDPFLLERPFTTDGPPDLIYNWLEIDVDEIGKAQLLEVLSNARHSVLMVEEQSVGRRGMTGENLTPVVVGIVGFRPEVGQ
jgi:DNA-binding transcriptional ArsR family regulator